MNGKIYQDRFVPVLLPLFSLLSLFLLASCVTAKGATTIWTGPEISSSKPNFGNPSLAANQDRLTSDIWITRSSSQGLYNAFSEPGFSRFFSPSGTEWANGSLANYSTLSYHDWNTWAKDVNAGPPTTVGINAVLHLIPDNIYLSVRFTSWTSSGSGGGFSYMRSTPAIVPEPSAGLLILVGMAVIARQVRRN
jgi:hypothetical protein